LRGLSHRRVHCQEISAALVDHVGRDNDIVARQQFDILIVKVLDPPLPRPLVTDRLQARLLVWEIAWLTPGIHKELKILPGIFEQFGPRFPADVERVTGVEIIEVTENCYFFATFWHLRPF
jgi:hypothetical protein